MSVVGREFRLVGGSAIGFAVSLFVYVTLIDLPDLTTTNGDAIAFYDGAAHRAQSIIGGYVAAVTAFLFVVFMVGAVRYLRLRGASAASVAAAVGGTAFVSLFLSAAALFVAPAFTLSLNNEPVALDADFALMARMTSVVGDSFFLMFAPFAAAVFVLALTLGGRGPGGWPRWLAVLGWVTTVTLVTPVVFFSLLLLLIWSIAVGVRLLVATPSPDARSDDTGSPRGPETHGGTDGGSSSAARRR